MHASRGFANFVEDQRAFRGTLHARPSDQMELGTIVLHEPPSVGIHGHDFGLPGRFCDRLSHQMSVTSQYIVNQDSK